ncbi:MAG: isoprenylcysteine carboxylmethyltransferase family protein [Anaerolineales bacterium]|nr:isoprenylcysteine carboxylmethyltransferase family protein [Anaerolineales bacterium]
MNELVYRILMLVAFFFMMGVRVYYQRKVLKDERKFEMREGKLDLIAGAMAALTSMVFGGAYILAPNAFKFAYIFHYPDWLRWVGVGLLAGGIALLWSAHHHLDVSFNSFVGTRENQTLVTSGPYRLIRHPIYTAYLMNYLGGGLIASHWILTFIPLLFFGILVINRMGKEEEMLREEFGEAYQQYAQKTGLLLLKLGK